jgi:PKD repeat protein
MGMECADTTVNTVTVPVGGTAVDYSLSITANNQILTSPPFIVQIQNTTPNASNYTFTWDFGDGTIEQNNSSTVLHEYLFNGLYDLTLIAEDTANGCSDTLVMEDYIYCSGGATGILSAKQERPYLYPNPTTGMISIIGMEEGIVVVYDVYGKRISTAKTNTLDISTEPTGIYFVHIIYEEGKRYTTKLVKCK